jgi:hypothetical protein
MERIARIVSDFQTLTQGSCKSKYGLLLARIRSIFYSALLADVRCTRRVAQMSDLRKTWIPAFSGMTKGTMMNAE